jgi:hypothetical protein
MLLADSYAGRVNRAEHISDAILHPILAPIEKLPRDMCFVIAGVDILLQEQLSFVQRLKSDLEMVQNPQERRLEAKVFEKGFHGWLERKSFLIILFHLDSVRS